MIHQFTALNPGGAIPLKPLIDPIGVDAAVHAMLHLQHIQDGIWIHNVYTSFSVVVNGSTRFSLAITAQARSLLPITTATGAYYS
jgi:hypothetical protein